MRPNETVASGCAPSAGRVEPLVNADRTPEQVALLNRMRRGALVFSGWESDAQRLAMLQLYTIRLVRPVTNPGKDAMAWRITGRGRTALRLHTPSS